MSDPFLLFCMSGEQEVLHERPFSAGLYEVKKNEALHERPVSAGLYELELKTKSYMSDPFLLACMMWRKTKS